MAKWTPGSPLLQRQGVGGLRSLSSPPSCPGAPPPYTLHLQGNLVLSTGAFIFRGEGGGKDSLSGNPLPGAPLKMVRYFLGSPTSPCPPGPTPGCGPVGTQALKTSSWIRLYHLLGLLAPSPHTNRYSPCLRHLQIRRTPLGIALLLLWNSSTHLSIRPSILVTS